MVKWMEVLVVRASKENIEKLLIDLPEKLDQLTKTKGLLHIAVHTNNDYKTDLSIQLQWEGEKVTDKSREGTLLAEYLSSFGMVLHSIWTQEIFR